MAKPVPNQVIPGTKVKKTKVVVKKPFFFLARDLIEIHKMGLFDQKVPAND